jgi:hypothetical protein
VIGLVVVLVFVAAVLVMEVLVRGRCLRRIESWAAANRFQIRSVKRRWFSVGAWGFWTWGGSRRYFDVTVTDKSGATRVGTAKIHGGFGGVVADVIDVRWV